MTTIDDDRNASLLRWALKVRRIMRPSSANSLLHVWLLRPAQLAVAYPTLFGLTYLAAAFRPRLLYAAETQYTNLAHRTAFLDCPIFTGLSLAVFDLLTGSALFDELVEQPRLAPAKSMLSEIHLEVLHYFLLLFLVLLSALQVWIGSRAAKAPLSMYQSAKVSGYGLAAVLISISILMSIYPFAITILDREMHVVLNALAIIVTVLLFVSFAGFTIYVTFVGPVTAYHPDVDRARLRFGWLVGTIVGQFLPLALGFLAAVLVAFVGGNGSSSATP